jgi:4-amino-4-deoxy-L-arabinose transferase-like glycosyltransferase
MKLNLKDEPKQWRKSALLAALGLALISSVLRWRHVLKNEGWLVILAVLAIVALAAGLRPRWFRPYHLLSMRLGFALSRMLGFVFLTLIFVVVVTPLGWILRCSGKDPLRLKRPSQTETYWQPAKPCGPLDRLF